MYVDYDLKKAIEYCDRIETYLNRDGCWQGMFMENINGAYNGKWKELGFSKEDPFAPCNTLEEQYQYECYINHGSWIMDSFKNDVVKMVESCAKLPEKVVTPCIESFTIKVTDPEEQKRFLHDSETRSMIENAVQICQRFPKRHRQRCINGAVDNVLNFDHLDLRRAEEFCQGMGKEYEIACFARIGLDMRNIAGNTQIAEKTCATLRNSEGQTACWDTFRTR